MHGVLNKVDQIYHEEGLFKDHYKRPLASFVDKLAEMPLLFQPGKGNSIINKLKLLNQDGTMDTILR